MNKNLSLMLFLLCAVLHCHAQDVIIRKSGDTVQAKVLDVNAAEVRYMKYGQTSGSSYVLLKSAIKQINYGNGIVDSFVVVPKVDTNALPGISDPFREGRRDARKYYNKYKALSFGTLFASVLSPELALIPAIAGGSKDPKERNLGYPNPGFLKNQAYVQGYKQEAAKIKQSNVWRYWCMGLVVNLFFVFATIPKMK